MRDLTALADQTQSYPVGLPAVPVDDSDTYQLQAAARELEAQLLFEQARRVADARALLVELYDRDGVQVEEAELDAQAEDVARLERGDRFLQEQAGRIDQDAELLGLAVQLDGQALEVWRQAAASLVEVCPPSLGHLRGRVEEERRAQLRNQAQGVRLQAALEGQLTSMGLVGRLADRRRVAELHGRLARCRYGLERSQARLGWLAAKLQVIASTERAREAWLADAHDVLARGVAAARVLDERAAVKTTGLPGRAVDGGQPMVGPRVRGFDRRRRGGGPA
jgi:hypothetical protein